MHGINQDVILRSPRGGRLEGRAALVQFEIEAICDLLIA
jgi:hypothetical protein